MTMLRELLSIFKASQPLTEMGNRFNQMILLARENTAEASQLFFEKKVTPEQRARIYEQDVRINKLERDLRKLIVAHLSMPGNQIDAPYCLALMSLVKDVERIGDFAKNLADVVDLDPAPLPDDAIISELRDISRHIGDMFASVDQIFSKSDRERAIAYVRAGKAIGQRTNALVRQLADSDYPPRRVCGVLLAARFFRRINGHLMNVLSAVVMPLHKIDYWDEDALLPGEAKRIEEIQKLRAAGGS